MKLRRLLLSSSLAVFTTIALSRGASAQEAPTPPPAERPLNRPGRVFIDDIFGIRMVMSGPSLGVLGGNLVTTSGVFGISKGTFTSTDGMGKPVEADSSSMWLAPALDVLVTEQLTLGGVVELHRSTMRPQNGDQVWRSRSYGVRPRIGWIAPIGQDLALWPRAYIGYSAGETDVLAPGVGSVTLQVFSAGADLPLMIRMGRHAYLNAGPSVTYFRSTTSPNATLSSQASEGLGAGGRVSFGLTF